MSEELRFSEKEFTPEALASKIIEKVRNSLSPELRDSLFNEELYQELETNIMIFLGEIPQDELLFSFYVYHELDLKYLAAIKTKDNEEITRLFKAAGGNEALSAYISDLVLKHFSKAKI